MTETQIPCGDDNQKEPDNQKRAGDAGGNTPGPTGSFGDTTFVGGNAEPQPHIVEVLFQMMTDSQRKVTYQVTARRGGMGESPAQFVVAIGDDRRRVVKSAQEFIWKASIGPDGAFRDMEAEHRRAQMKIEGKTS